MMNSHCFEAVERMLRDIMRNDVPFGGKVRPLLWCRRIAALAAAIGEQPPWPARSQVVVLGGDFRQILPVLPRGGRPQIVAASLGLAGFWHHVTVVKLQQNMRVQRVLAQAGAAAAVPIARVSHLCRPCGHPRPASASPGLSD